VVLSQVNLTVRQDDFIGVIGPNGGGKTTLLKVITGQLKPISGNIRFYAEGHDFIGYMPQVMQFDSRFPITVGEVVHSGLISRKKMGLRITPEERARVMEQLERMGIIHLRKKSIGELSGGEKQRVFLCRSIVSDPKLLILDEPNTFVDNMFEHDLYELVRELNTRMAVIMVSHDVGTISAYVKTIACVNKTLHYHPSNIITEQQLAGYDCPIQLITHGNVPHTVLKIHTP
jgi:zinc transport system ATP-binding protein